MRGDRILLTGGTGFFGCWLVESFCHINQAPGLGARMVVLTRNVAGFAAKCPHVVTNSAIALYSGDIRSFTFPLANLDMSFMPPTHVPNCGRRSARYLLDNRRRNGTILQFAAASAARKFLLTSSGAVYAKHPPGMSHVQESYTGSPNPVDRESVYGESKPAAEPL